MTKTGIIRFFLLKNAFKLLKKGGIFRKKGRRTI